jgi:Tfp pilus assembly protein PilF
LALKPVVIAPVSAVLALNSPDVAPRKPTDEKTFATIPGTGKPALNKRAPRGANAALAKTLDIQHEPESDTIDTILALAYKTYQKGDYASANQHYREAFAIAPKNRDALLGLAVIAQRQEQDDAALHYYLQVLLLDPRDPVAHAGLASFGRGDTVTKESRLKQLISQQPDAAALHFVLGHQYADQARWSDAQQAYFNALAMEPGNALFAFNLAISLDHLGQRKAAAKYYQQAILFDPSGNSGFSRTQTLQRLNELTASDQ